MVPENNPVAEAAKTASKPAEEMMANAANAFGGAMGATFKAVQDYQAKLMHFFQQNAEANMQLSQKLMQTRSPSDFVEAMSGHLRERASLISEQAKELASLGQEASRKAMESMTSQPKR
ncbi:MAG TPA: phasin family protein [Roseiarcus sp.]|nr:phasin family protein [Roseiarcus sp.]